MPCALCQKSKTLRRSHIVPEFLYQGMYDQKHRFLGMSTTPAQMPQLYQKGFREELLCEDCEQQFGRYEKYAAEFFYGGGAPVAIGSTQTEAFIRSLDYDKIKLFFMSLLWRFGITTVKELRAVSLGPHADRLRKLLRANDPGDANTYPCLVTAVTFEGKFLGNIMVPPCVGKLEARHVWHILVSGCVLSFFVSSHPPPAVSQPHFLQKNGSLRIAIRDIRNIDFLHRYFCLIRQAKQTGST